MGEATQSGNGQGQRREGATPGNRRAAIAARMAKLLTTEPDAVPKENQSFLERLLAQTPALGEAAAIAKRLSCLLRREGNGSLDRVLADAIGTLFADFAAKLGRDRAAVQAALDTLWTTSPTEGQINRVKAIKRSMYGRTSFPLLRARVLHAA